MLFSSCTCAQSLKQVKNVLYKHKMRLVLCSPKEINSHAHMHSHANTLAYTHSQARTCSQAQGSHTYTHTLTLVSASVIPPWILTLSIHCYKIRDFLCLLFCFVFPGIEKGNETKEQWGFPKTRAQSLLHPPQLWVCNEDRKSLETEISASL